MSLAAFVVAGNTSCSFSFLPVPLDACVVATLLLLFACNLGRLGHICVLFFSPFLLLFFPHPLPPCAKRGYIQTNEVFATGSWLLTGLSLSFGSLLIGPAHTFYVFSFMSILSSCPVIFTLFFLYAHFCRCLDLSLCTRADLFQPARHRCSRLATKRFGSSVFPFHLVFPSSATTHFCLVSSSFHVFSLSLLRVNVHAHISPLVLLCLPSGRPVCV